MWRDAQALAGNHPDVASAAPARSPSTPPRPSLPTPSAQKVYLAWYGGLGAMTIMRFIEWRLAAVVAVAHTVERYGHRQRVREFVEGLDSGF